MIPLFELNPGLDRKRLAAHFAVDRRIQVRDLLTPDTARRIHGILSRQTRWGLAWQAGGDGPHAIQQEQLASLDQSERAKLSSKVVSAMKARDYAFIYAQYPMLRAYLEGWDKDSPHDLLLEHINSEPLLELVREVTGIPELIKADAQATLYGPHHFLGLHDDSHVAEGWRVAYVMNFCLEEWRPEWGGYLMFYDQEGDVVAGFRPRFNVLNLFLVPQKHNVSYVPGFAPADRFAITGWFRDR